MNKLDVLKNYKFQINDRVYSKDYDANGTVVSLSQNIVFNEDTNEYEIANYYGVEFDTDDEELYNIHEYELKLIPRELKFPSLYKHFKGQYYGVIGISLPINEINEYDAVETSKHTEVDRLVSVYYIQNENKYVHLCDSSKDVLVVYRPVYLGGRQLYARPLEMFLSEVDREKYPNVEQRFRFEEVK